ncbi:hypothetical protein F0562_001306 [Nyssa sinensis]|uniref:Translation elongation factor P/YeiP central domain-containing protein n=1 Tax=Nyssa sinensis TaxID=561372 RepID=A0A5J5C3Y9_9ASTE|nr:hypothetical protein F0562_001306 [Nyssa sinensis]
MRFLCKRLSRALYLAAATSSFHRHASLISRALSTCRSSHPLTNFPDHASRGVLAAQWSATQHRGVKIRGSDVKPGQVIERKGKIYQVLKSQHNQQGRGGAVIQVELRDVDSGNKTSERIRTEEAVERVFVEEKSYKYLYTDDDVVVLMEPNTFEQLDVPKDMFGEAAVYLKDDMRVTVELYDEKPMSASVPQRVTCKVVEAQVPMKGIAATPHYKKVLLDNGLTVQVPPFILTGDEIVINTTDNSYITRA